MKVFILTITMMLHCVSFVVFADAPDTLNPLAETQVIREGGDELIGIRTNTNNGTDYHLTIEVTRYFDNIDSLIRVLEYSVPDITVDRNFNRYGIATLDANGNGLSEIAAAWTTNNRIDIVALTADPNKLGAITLGEGVYQIHAEWEDTTRLSRTSPAPYSGDAWLRTPPLLTSGDFTGNGKDELALAYLANHLGNVVVNLSLFEINGDIHERAFSRVQQIRIDQPQSLRPTGRPLTIFDMTAGDFNGDGKDDILLVGRESDTNGNWNLFASIYSFQSPNSLVRVLHEVIYTMPDSDPNIQFEIQNISVAKGHFLNDQSEQAVVSFTQYNTHDIYASYMIGLSFDNALEQITITEEPFRRLRANQAGQGAYWDNVVRTGDITGNGLHEIVSNAGYRHLKRFNIYRLNEELQFIEYAHDLNIPQHNTSPVFALGDVMRGETGAAELATPKQSLYKFNINPNGSYQGATLVLEADFGTYGCWFPGGDYQYDCSSSLIVADLDGDIRIGTPRRYRISNITHPLVILKAPPAHFDIIDGVVYDITNSYYPNTSSNFSVHYTTEAAQQNSISTEFTRDWGVSAKLSAGGSFLGTGVSAHLEANYGKQFTKKGTNTRTVTVGTSVAASRDDRIYATTMSYDVWEYPVISDGVERGHILVIDPAVTNDTWLPGRSGSADAYIQNHEVGNLLSYRGSPPGSDEIGEGDIYTAPEFELDENSGVTTWKVNIDEFTESGTTQKKDFHMNVGASVQKWGVKLEIGGNYGTQDISTQSTTLTDKLEIEINLGALRTGFGDVSYKVQPFVYWTNDGALVVDYAVQPSIQAGPTSPTTFWSNRYGNKPDPAFIMPWRYYKEMVGDTQDHERRHQTRDISFYPENPVSGDIVTITANVRNFSLVEKSERVGVSFYLGDPDNGGTLITGLGNTTSVYTNGGIPARGTRTVQMQWAIPNNVIGTKPRIYGVIHSDQSAPEIHNNNNKGWSILGKEGFGTGTDVEKYPDTPVTFALQQNYPNPFNPATTFEFSIPSSGMVTLEIYNILGQRVATLISEDLSVGSHSHYWDAQGLSSGVYIYRLQAGGLAVSRKMLLLK